MALYLVQHGKSLPKEVDAERGLSDEGVKDVIRVAETAQNYKVPVRSIEHSGKHRAAQTAEIFAEKLGIEKISSSNDLKPLDDVIGKAETIIPTANLMLVGHLPFMEKLISYLTTGSTDFTIFKFQNGGLVCLDKLENATLWTIKWALMPHVT